jgi:hypothetical protein
VIESNSSNESDEEDEAAGAVLEMGIQGEEEADDGRDDSDGGREERARQRRGNPYILDSVPKAR